MLPRIVFGLFLGLVLTHATLAGMQIPAGERAEMRLTTNHEPLSYAPGEAMEFTITLNVTAKAAELPLHINWERTGDDGQKESGRVRYAGKPVKITSSLKTPGFVRIYAKLTDADGAEIKNAAGKSVFADGGAGVEPGKLRGTAEPEDFDRFWQNQLKKLAAVPLKAEMKQIQGSANVDIYLVSVTCAGKRPCTGYLRIPKNAAPHSLPAQVYYNGYGYYGGKDGPPRDGRKDRIVFDINAHGYEVGRDAAYYKEFAREAFQGKRYAYDREENKNPETAYFCDMSLRALRALEFVRTLPQWNGKDLIVAGGSQGAMQAVWCAAWDKKVTFADIQIPWCCDVSGPELSGRLPGGRPPYEKGLEYFDTAHCAKRITCPVTISRAGLGDYVCPPSGVSVFYQALPGKKEIRWYQNSEHNYVPSNPEIYTYTGDLPKGK